MQHRVLKYYQVCSNDDPGLTLTYFTARSNLVPYAFVWEKGKIMDFSKTVVVCDIKVGRFSQLNEYMNFYEYKRSWSFIDLRPRSLRFNISNFFCSETARPIEAKFHMAPPWDLGNENLFKCSRSDDHAHIYNLVYNIGYSSTTNVFIWWLWVDLDQFLWQGQICFQMLLREWKLIQHWVLMYSNFGSDSAYPQHSRERYRTNGPLVVYMLGIRL